MKMKNGMHKKKNRKTRDNELDYSWIFLKSSKIKVTVNHKLKLFLFV